MRDGRRTVFLAIAFVGLALALGFIAWQSENRKARLAAEELAAAATPNAPRKTAVPRAARKNSETPAARLAATADFVLNHLVREDGSVCSSYAVDWSGNVVPGQSTLSESQGLMLEYAYQAEDRALFTKIYDYTQSISVDGLTAWQVENGSLGAVNATLDDLRILSALMRAEEKWGGYEADIERRSAALLDKAVSGGELVDYAALRGGNRGWTLTLCYVDLRTLEALSNVDARWQAVREAAEKRLVEGYISDEFPLYRPRYDYSARAYTGDELQMAEAMVTLKHLGEAGLLRESTAARLYQFLREGKICARYDTSGAVVSHYGYESTAIYALLVQTALAVGDRMLAELALECMDQTRVDEASSPLCGTYGGTRGAEHSSFDVLEALLALQMMAG